MDKNKLQTNRFLFRILAFIVTFAVLIIGATLSYLDGGATFGPIAMSVMGFVGAVFVADYATKVDTD